jgi:hypothetical protein
MIARRTPELGQAASAATYVEVGTELSAPPYARLRPVSNQEALEVLLSRLAGIEENIREPPPGHTRKPFAANIRHSAFFVFQRQDEIISQRYLFHKQGDEWVTQAIRDVLPFFLGAVDNDELAKREELRRLQRELRSLRRRLEEADAIQGDGLGRAIGLHSEAVAVGLARHEEGPIDGKEARTLLAAIVEGPRHDEDEEATAAYNGLLQQQIEMRREYARLSEELETLKLLASERQSFGFEAREQAGRLRSLEIFPRWLVFSDKL